MRYDDSINRPDDRSGLPKPQLHMVPDELFDDLMVELSGPKRRCSSTSSAAPRVQTGQRQHQPLTDAGRHRGSATDAPSIAVSGSRKKTLLQALRSLEDQHIILTERRQSVEKGNEPTAYRLNVLAKRHCGRNSTPLGGSPPRGRGRNSAKPRGVSPHTKDSSTTNRCISFEDSNGRYRGKGTGSRGWSRSVWIFQTDNSQRHW